jgi:hypothetical protein
MLNRFTKYYHLLQGTATLDPSDPDPDSKLAHLGMVMGQIDNAGYSTEPHLHIGCYKLDATGRLRAVPMKFAQCRLYQRDRPTTIQIHEPLQ